MNTDIARENTTLPFVFGETTVRAILRDGKPLFVAKDVCQALGIRNHRDAVEFLDADEKDDVGITDAIGRNQATTLVSESGVYALIFRSRKPEAREFRRWVTTEVLPSIRQHGYFAPRTRAVLEFIRQLLALGCTSKDACLMARNEFPAARLEDAFRSNLSAHPENPIDALLEIMVPGHTYTVDELISFLPENAFVGKSERGARTAVGSRLSHLAALGRIRIHRGRYRRYSLSTIVSMNVNLGE